MNPCRICHSQDAKRRNFKDCREFFCERCHKIARRRFNSIRGKTKRKVDVPTRKEWIDALIRSWDARQGCFVCGITGVSLTPDKPQSPRYPTQEHVIPGSGKGGWMIVAAAINDMKSDLSLKEFREAIPLIGGCLRKGAQEKYRRKLHMLLDRLKHWKRV